MGFYIRKSFRVGGVRLNLSKSGLGVSTGVRGFRLGMNGRGTYVHMGRGGLYYRKQLSWNSRSRPSPSLAGPRPAPIVQSGDASIVSTEDLAQPISVSETSSSEAAVLAHFRPHYEWSWLIAVCGAVAVLEAFSSAILSVAFAFGALGLFALRQAQAQRAVLIYDLDGPALERYQAFVESFAAFFRSRRIWLYEQHSLTSDWKRNAGATHLMKRRLASVLADGDPKIAANLSIPCLTSGNERIYFLPDLVVVRQGSRLTACSYDDLRIEVGTEIFIEESAPPSDAEVVGHAWRYSNRDGGPDRRFNNNQQFPKCRYQSVELTAKDVFKRSFSKSSIDNFAPLASGLKRLAELMITARAPLATSTSPPIVS